MRFVPVNLGFSNRTILKTNGRIALQLAPVTTAEAPLEMGKIPDAVPGCDDLNGPDLTDYFERLLRRHIGRLPTARYRKQVAGESGTYPRQMDTAPGGSSQVPYSPTGLPRSSTIRHVMAA